MQQMAESTERMQLIDYLADNKQHDTTIAAMTRVRIHAWAIGKKFAKLFKMAQQINAITGIVMPDCEEYRNFYSMPIKG